MKQDPTLLPTRVIMRSVLMKMVLKRLVTETTFQSILLTKVLIESNIMDMLPSPAKKSVYFQMITSYQVLFVILVRY